MIPIFRWLGCCSSVIASRMVLFPTGVSCSCSPKNQLQVSEITPFVEWEAHYITGWWLTYPSEKYEFVNWDDDIPSIWKNKKCSKPPTNQWFFSQIHTNLNNLHKLRLWSLEISHLVGEKTKHQFPHKSTCPSRPKLFQKSYTNTELYYVLNSFHARTGTLERWNPIPPSEKLESFTWQVVSTVSTYSTKTWNSSAGWWCNNHHNNSGYMMVIWWDYKYYIYIWLVVPCAHLEKWWTSSVGKDDIPYMKWKINFIFETTNQVLVLWH